jgi:hypothetical protein
MYSFPYGIVEGDRSSVEGDRSPVDGDYTFKWNGPAFLGPLDSMASRDRSES